MEIGTGHKATDVVEVHATAADLKMKNEMTGCLFLCGIRSLE